MVFNKRKNRILKLIVREYIKRAEPISSGFLRENYNLGISAPTIRIEMGELTRAGYLWQSHTSGGRIPTDKGYRFFVDDLFKNDFSEFIDEKFLNSISEKFPKKTKKGGYKEPFEFIQYLTRILAATSSNFILTYLFEKELFWKEGLGEVFQEPEFEDSGFCCDFIEMIDDFENAIKNFAKDEFLTPEIFIGQENLLPRAQDFTTIICKCRFPENQDGFISILGPKRMAYDKNIKLINSALKLLNSYSQ